MPRLEICVTDLLSIVGQPSSAVEDGTRTFVVMDDGSQLTDPAEVAAAFAGTPALGYTYIGSRGEPSEADSFVILGIET